MKLRVASDHLRSQGWRTFSVWSFCLYPRVLRILACAIDFSYVLDFENFVHAYSTFHLLSLLPSLISSYSQGPQALTAGPFSIFMFSFVL